MFQRVTQTLEIPVRNECDILVIGAGPAGIGAALTAARKGARVTLVEYGGKLGGMWTLGLLSPFFDNRDKPGLNQELREKLAERHAWGGLWDMAFDPSQMVLLLNQMALEAKPESTSTSHPRQNRPISRMRASTYHSVPSSPLASKTCSRQAAASLDLSSPTPPTVSRATAS